MDNFEATVCADPTRPIFCIMTNNACRDKMTPEVSSFLTKSSFRGFTAAAVAASADGSLFRGVTTTEEEDEDTDVDDLIFLDESSTPYALRGFRGRAVGRLDEDDDVLGLVDT